MKNPDSDRPHSDEWDEHFRQRFADFQSAPPADALQHILADLSQSAAEPAPQSIGGRGKWRWVGLGALSLLIGMVWLNQSAQMPTGLPQKGAQVSSAKTKLAESTQSERIAGQTTEPIYRPVTEFGGNEIVAKKRTRVEQTVANTVKKSVESVSGLVKTFQDKQISVKSSPKVESLAESHLSGRSVSTQPLMLAQLAGQPLQAMLIGLRLPPVTAMPQTDAPEKPAVQRLRPVVFGCVMPLYSYQRINPVQNDDVVVKNITTQKALSTQRMGVRLQAGVEWPLTRRMALRTSVTYNQLGQYLSYLTRSDQPDSVRVERINTQTVRLTPYFNDKRVTTRTNWHYVGLGTDLVWQLGKFGGWRHYTTLGVSIGTYVGESAGQPQGPVSGFVQGGYGLERPLTPTLWLRVAPTIQYGLGTIRAHDGLLQIRPYTYGLTIGLRR